ncbi:YIP1 family protein [Deinococcus pimensis]|uniref:YIP1 family protein n=1 Tax=Deinococcus pimensis TaxID=309888 RepID=UPI0004818507|nr:YIP1 family protein [Deinococcus pimensis]
MRRPTTLPLDEMFRQSVHVITHPSVTTFERYERAGSLSQAVVYVALTGAVAGLLDLLRFGFGGWLERILVILGGFLAFTLTVYFFGRSRGGTGTLDEVAYTFSLYWVPISIVVAVLTFLLAVTIVGILLIPLVLLAGLVASVYFAYLAVQSSMNLRGTSTVAVILVVAAVVSWVVQVVLGRIL